MKTKRLLVAALGVGITLALFLYLQSHYAFNYYFEEQFQLFRFSADYARECLQHIGGPAAYLGAFLVQFFIHPYAGAAISVLLYLLTVGGLRACALRLSGGKELPLAYLLPGMFFLWAGADVNCHFDAGLSFALLTWLLAAYLRVPKRSIRLTVALPLSWLLFYAVGPMFIGWAAACCVIELGQKGKGRWWSLLLLPGAWLAPLLCYSIDATEEPLHRLLTMEFYSNALAPAPIWTNGALISWCVMLVLTQLYPLCPKGKRPWVRYTSWGLQLFLAAVVCVKAGSIANPENNYVAKRLDYYARQERWNDILSEKALRPSKNLIHACYQNLALARLGKLSESCIVTPQVGTRGLWVKWNQTTFTSALLSDVCYTMGQVALAQTLAFEGLVATERSENPRLLLRLVQTNLIEGAYPVAEKYIRYLLQSHAYRKQAAHYATFLYDDRRVEADDELGPLRRCRSQVEGLTTVEQGPMDLWHVMHSNPSYRPAFDYFGAFCLLSRDMQTFGIMLDEFRTAPALQPMPRIFQEAALMLHEKEPETWAEYGISQETQQRFLEFRKMLMLAKTNRTVANQLQTHFGKSYWYYFMRR